MGPAENCPLVANLKETLTPGAACATKFSLPYFRKRMSKELDTNRAYIPLNSLLTRNTSCLCIFSLSSIWPLQKASIRDRAVVKWYIFLSTSVELQRLIMFVLRFVSMGDVRFFCPKFLLRRTVFFKANSARIDGFCKKGDYVCFHSLLYSKTTKIQRRKPMLTPIWLLCKGRKKRNRERKRLKNKTNSILLMTSSQ